MIVDEAGMVSTDKLHQLARLSPTTERGESCWPGIPMQFSAVGRGGMFEYLIDTCGAIELDQVHRFTNDWERAASLQLRRGDPAVASVSTTTTIAFTAERQPGCDREALDAWQAGRRAGEIRPT